MVLLDTGRSLASNPRKGTITMVWMRTLHHHSALVQFVLVAAYAAGTTSIYGIALAGAVLVYVVIHVLLFTLDDKDGRGTGDEEKKAGERVEMRRKWLLLSAVLAATITYQAGLTPPGGVMVNDDDDDDDAVTGRRTRDPVLLNQHPRRHRAVFYLCLVTFFLCIAPIIRRRLFLVKQPAWTLKSSTGTPVYVPPEYIKRSVEADICRYYVLMTEAMMNSKSSEMPCTIKSIEAVTGNLRNRLQATLSHKFEQSKRRIEVPLNCLGTGKTTRPKISSILLALDSGGSKSVKVDVAKTKPSQACNTTPNMDKAPPAQDSLDLALDPNGSDRHQHIIQSNLTDERNDKPRSNSAPATNSSDETTRAPTAHNKLTTHCGAENHSEADFCVAERDDEAVPRARWYMATGAARHATGNPDLITDLQVDADNNGGCVYTADGTPLHVLGIGNVVTDTVVLPDVAYVPGLCTNVVSVGQLTGKDYSVGFGRGECVVNSAAGTVVGRAHARKDGLYEVDFLRVPLDMR